MHSSVFLRVTDTWIKVISDILNIIIIIIIMKVPLLEKQLWRFLERNREFLSAFYIN